MAVRAHFVNGPLHGEWKAMQDLLPKIRVAKRGEIELDAPIDETAEAAVIQGTYARTKSYTTDDEGVVKAWYVWQGWDDELQEVQESERY